jgi:dipeptidyl aminopeptidase/acylaminoacyl peptidase
MPKPTSFGSWKSPITSDLIVSETISFDQSWTDGEDVYWIESRPAEGGRSVIMRWRPAGEAIDVNPAPYNARTRVHEYGGGAMLAVDGVVFFSNFSDQCVYRIDPGVEPRMLTPLSKDGQWRYADFITDKSRQRILCVREEHRDNEVVNTIVALPMDNDASSNIAPQGTILVAGNDFYAAPRLSPDGKMLAWLTWNHPNMPWDATQLWLANIPLDGSPTNPRCVAGLEEQESISQPEWSPDGCLYFISDRSGWWNLYRLDAQGMPEAIYPMEAEFSRPQWVFHMSSYGFLSEEKILCTYLEHGFSRIATIDLRTRRVHNLKTPYNDVRDLCVNPCDGTALIIASSTGLPLALLRLDFRQAVTGAEGDHRIVGLRYACRVDIDPGYLSIPQEVEFPTTSQRTAFGFFYRPQNKDFTPPENEKPPLIVISHGGPTGFSDSGLSLISVQFWTSRGFAVLDVNYGGSSGYGRPYRQRLYGNWGVVDIDDCVNGALYLAGKGLVDGERMAIRGGSAGGYTTLAALTFRKVFKAGASYYGVSDLEAIARDTHKFESRYMDSLVGPYPDQKELYRSRSPIHYIHQIDCPMILFQGMDDKVVLPNQAEEMVASLKKKNLPVAYLAFEGEGHGFRRAENIKRTLDAELYFYGRVFGFPVADAVAVVEIFNL